VSKARSYADRFGYTWSVRAETSVTDEPPRIVFRNRRVRMVATAEESLNTLSSEQLKELFCDAERVLESDGVTWYVGYRDRTAGRGGGRYKNLCTRFRSATGELRYARDIIDFRHMTSADLCRQLGRAQAAPGQRVG
jgi:hypothetical protein